MDTIKVRFTVGGSNYVIVTTDTEEYVNELARTLEADIRGVMAGAPSASVTQAAVLTAMDYLDELKKSSNSVDNMRNQIRGYLEDAARAKQEAEEARRALQRLQMELNALKEERNEK